MFTTLSFVVVGVSAVTVIAPNGPVHWPSHDIRYCGWVGVPFLAGLYDDRSTWECSL